MIRTTLIALIIFQCSVNCRSPMSHFLFQMLYDKIIVEWTRWPLHQRSIFKSHFHSHIHSFFSRKVTEYCYVNISFLKSFYFFNHSSKVNVCVVILKAAETFHRFTIWPAIIENEYIIPPSVDISTSERITSTIAKHFFYPYGSSRVTHRSPVKRTAFIYYDTHSIRFFCFLS